MKFVPNEWGLYKNRRSLHGERGLKSKFFIPLLKPFSRRSLHGERGLKFLGPNDSMQAYWSLPSRGAWIEILIYNQCGQPARSLPSRGAWIEINRINSFLFVRCVAPFTGSVD